MKQESFNLNIDDILHDDDEAKRVHLLQMLEVLHLLRKLGASKTGSRFLTERRFICAMDRAAACPSWWFVNRMHFYNPGMTHSQIGRCLGLKREYVTRMIRDVCIPDDDYAEMPYLSSNE